MKKIILFWLLYLCSASFLLAQQDTLILKKEKKLAGGALIIKGSDSLFVRPYNPVEGYFQKANHDVGDPRFMLASEDNSFKFGIGGYVKVIGFADFGGAIDCNDFIVSMIPTPTQKDGQFKLFANSSRINFKVVHQKKRTIVGFIEADFAGGSDGHFKLRHAYISFAGFTIGQTWSTFMDLEASPCTIDGEGPNNQVMLRQPMIRYTLYKPKFQFAVAAELPTSNLLDFGTPSIKVYPQKQRVPDFITHFKFKWNKGHVQIGGVLRVINYGDSASQKNTNFIPSGGISINSKVEMWKGASFYCQVNAGMGISKYIQDLSIINYDMFPNKKNGNMDLLNMAGGYASIQQFWHQKVHSNIIYGITFLDIPGVYDDLEKQKIQHIYKYSHYFAINTLWNVYDFGTLGIEYLFGQRVNNNNEKGSVNRVNLLIQYNF